MAALGAVQIGRVLNSPALSLVRGDPRLKACGRRSVCWTRPRVPFRRHWLRHLSHEVALAASSSKWLADVGIYQTGSTLLVIASWRH
jgi:hypothetical protein